MTTARLTALLTLSSLVVVIPTWAAPAESGSIRIAGLQMRVTHDIACNEERILAGIERAAREEVELLVTPEGSLSGYHPHFERDVLDAALQRVCAAARQARVGLALGTCYKEQRGEREYCYNQVRLYSPEGDYLGNHAKILRCSPPDMPGTGEMTHYVEGRLRTFDWRGIRLGILICNDLWATPGYTTMPNPYLPWKLKQMGAQVILHAIYSGSQQDYRPFHESSVELWARALRIPIVEVNAAVPEGQKVNAASGVVGSAGRRLLSVCDEGEQFFTCQLAIPSAEKSLP
jgi:predicted amidohydrolase